MTIAVAIRTGSAVVFAADSKLTTRGMTGLDEHGESIWVDQSYDNATKVPQERSQRLMLMVAGDVNLGQRSATDFIATWSMEGLCPALVMVRCNSTPKSDKTKTLRPLDGLWTFSFETVMIVMGEYLYA